jgi:hypothetical protein
MAIVMAASPGVQAHGLLGLFAPDRPSAPPVAERAEATRPVAPKGPVAWISGLRGVADPAAMLYGYVEAGQTFQLGAQGEMTLTFLSPCHEETVVGGTLTVGADGVRINGGAIPNSRALSCRPVRELLPGTDPASKLPDTGPFRQEDWYEVSINSAEPIFRWPASVGDAAQIEVIDLDMTEPASLWSTRAYSGAASYPREAPVLEQGRPYLVRASVGNGPVYEAVFSLDPDLAYSSAPVNGLVLLRPAEDRP